MRALSPLWVGKLTVISKTSQCGEVFSSPSLCYSWKQELIYEVSQTRFTTSLLGEAWLPKGYGGGLPLEWGSKVNVEVQSYLRHHIDAQVQVMMTQVVDKVLRPRGEEELWKLGSPSLIASSSWNAVALHLRQIKSHL